MFFDRGNQPAGHVTTDLDRDAFLIVHRRKIDVERLNAGDRGFAAMLARGEKQM